MSRRATLTAAVVAFAVALVTLVAIIVLLAGGGASTLGGSAGERIFRAGIGTDGRAIPRTGGMMMPMMASGCAGCHGPDGQGRSTPSFTAPNITYANLTNPQGMLEPDGTRGPTFTNAAIRRAVIQGIDPEGNPLAWPMPRWDLSSGDWSALIAYLKTLK